MSHRPLNLPRLAWRYLWARPMLTALNLLLLTLGLAAIGVVLLVSEQLERGLKRDLAGIDLVVGAKGSPMQILLSGVFHLDQSTGNIPLDTVRQLAAQPLVAQAVPISLGDSFRGHRIVGTTVDYLALYQLELASGRRWQRPMEAVLGAAVAGQAKLGVGDRFQGSHGLGEQGDLHDHPYEVVGVLAPTGGVVDRLVLTDLASVWEAHAQHGHAPAVAPAVAPSDARRAAAPASNPDHAHRRDQPHDHHGPARHERNAGARPDAEHDTAHGDVHGDVHGDRHAHGVREGQATTASEPTAARNRQLTASAPDARAEPQLEVSMVLVRYRGPLGAAMLPRWVNAQPGLQASVPALETARLLNMVGIGVDVLRGFGLVLLLAAALSVLVALLNAVRERQTDLAMLRMLGATPLRVSSLIALEALMLAGLAAGAALALSHALVGGLGWVLSAQQSVRLSGAVWSTWELLLPAAALLLALLAAAWPAWRGYRLDVTELLQTPR